MPETTKPYFPMFVNISAKHTLVIGGGKIARRRITTLLNFTNHLTVIAPDFMPEVAALDGHENLTLIQKNYESTDITGMDLVFAATNNETVNNQIHQDCQEQGILVNIGSDKTKCDFYFPGIVQKEQVVVGVTTGGTNHKLAKEVTAAVREMLAE